MVHVDGHQGCDCHELVEHDKFWDGHVDVFCVSWCACEG